MNGVENNSQSNAEYPSAKIAWTTVAVLSFTYMFSFMDRQILVLLIDPIKVDLQITDTQVSLLTGMAFAVVYALAGIPMGRAADLGVRKYVIIGGVTVWSTLTILCGFARSFPQLFLGRMGVGLGEAALTPTAYALIPDLFPPNKLARAISVFAIGGFLGSGLAWIFGGVIIDLIGNLKVVTLPLVGEIRAWQIVLVIAGSLSLLMVVPLALLPEPKRHNPSNEGVSTPSVDISTTNNAGAEYQNLAFKAVLRYLWGHKGFYGLFIIGVMSYTLSGYGIAAWLPSYFIRVHGWDAGSAGVTLGSLYLAPVIIGGLASGWLADHFYGKGYQTAPLVIMSIAPLLLAPLLLCLIYTPVMGAKLTALVLLFFVDTMLSVLFPTVIQLATHNRIRAQVSAIHLMIINLVGIGFGPTAIALVTDNVFQDELAVGDSIALVGVIACLVSAATLILALKPFKQRVISIMGPLEKTPANAPKMNQADGTRLATVSEISP